MSKTKCDSNAINLCFAILELSILTTQRLKNTSLTNDLTFLPLARVPRV